MAPGAGKESVVPVMIGFGYPGWLVLAGIVTIDMTLAVLISLNFDLLLKIPVLGKVLMFFTEKTNKILQKRPWIKGLSVGGLLLVINPLACLISGIVFGLVCGLKKSAILHPFIAGIAFIPTLYLYYNDSAPIYLAFYIITAVMGIGIGWTIYLKK